MQTTDNQYGNPYRFAKQGCKTGAKKVQNEGANNIFGNNGGVVDLTYNPKNGEFEPVEKTTFNPSSNSKNVSWEWWRFVAFRALPVWCILVLLYALPTAAVAMVDPIMKVLEWGLKLVILAVVAYGIVIAVWNYFNQDGILDPAPKNQANQPTSFYPHVRQNRPTQGYQAGNINVNIQINGNEY